MDFYLGTMGGIVMVWMMIGFRNCDEGLGG